MREIKIIILSIILAVLAASCAPDLAPEPETMDFYYYSLPCLTGELTATYPAVDGMTLSVYERADPDTKSSMYMAQLNAGDYTYYLGTSSSSNFNLSRSPYTYMSNPVYSWVEEPMGAASVPTMHLITFLDGASPTELAAIQGIISLNDLDGDDVPELIACIGTGLPTYVNIYFWNNKLNNFTVLDVNEALNANDNNVYYENGVFIVEETSNSRTSSTIYEYINGEFIK